MANSDVRTWMAPDLFPAMMFNPFGAMLVYMSRVMLRIADVVEQVNSSRSSKSKENLSNLIISSRQN